MVKASEARRRRLAGAAALLLIAVVVAACGQGSPSGSGTTTDTIQVVFDHYPTTFHSLAYQVAMSKGFFADQHIKIDKVVGSEGGGTTVRNLLEGKLAFGDVALSAAVEAYEAGAPLKIVAGSVDNLGDTYFVTRKDAPISSPAEMAGHTWCYTSPGSTTQVLTLLILQKAGVDPQKVTMRAAGGISQGLTLLKQGQCDAAVLAEPNYSAEKSQWKTLVNVGQYISPFQQNVLITSPQLIQKNPSLIRRFLLAVQKAQQWIEQNPQQAAQIFATNAKADQPSAESAAQSLAAAHYWDLALHPGGVANVVKGSAMVGLEKSGTKIDWTELLDQDFLPSGVTKASPGELPATF